MSCLSTHGAAGWAPGTVVVLINNKAAAKCGACGEIVELGHINGLTLTAATAEEVKKANERGEKK